MCYCLFCPRALVKMDNKAIIGSSLHAQYEGSGRPFLIGPLVVVRDVLTSKASCIQAAGEAGRGGLHSRDRARVHIRGLASTGAVHAEPARPSYEIFESSAPRLVLLHFHIVLASRLCMLQGSRPSSLHSSAMSTRGLWR